jgi:hypothetical protein
VTPARARRARRAEAANSPPQPMLDATPHHVFSWDFTVSRGGRPVAEVDMSWFRERAEVDIGGRAYQVQRESIIDSTFSLSSGGEVLARAQKLSVFTRTFEVTVAGRRFELRALSAFRRGFGLFQQRREVGRVMPVSWLGRKASIELPDDLPLPVQVFVFWLVIVLWRRAANSSSSAGAT